MKNFTNLIFAILFVNVTAFSQPCLPEGITFYTQEQIDNFQTNYPGCTEIEGDVKIGEYGGSDITNLNGLNVLTSIGGSLHIGFIGMYVTYWNNPLLGSLTGLENLTSIGENLWIMDNDLLIDLTGLEALTSIDGFLKIIFNDVLNSLTGLDNVQAETISDLFIQGNSSLSTCEVLSICNYLADPNGEIEIGNNAPGCNSPEEVDSLCNPVSVQDLRIENIFTISPNPTSGSVYLKFENHDHGIVICNLFQVSGLKVKKILNEQMLSGTHEIEIDLSDLPVGIYFSVLKTIQGIQTKRSQVE
ncbi:MAG: T9SS type A sorting domain-containing protein [Bacteroidales bacterium]